MKSNIARQADSLLRSNHIGRGEQPVATFARAVVNGKNEVMLDFSKIKSIADLLDALGISLTSPNGTKWRLSINDDGQIERTAVQQ